MRTNDYQKKLSLLIVDDDPQVLKILRQLIDKAIPGAEITSESSSRAALEKALSSPPDGALVDYRMPGIDGIEFCRRLHDNPATQFVPVILMTGHDISRELLREGLEADALDFLQKPVDVELLIAKLRVLSRLHSREQELHNMNLRLEELVEQRTGELREREKQFRNVVENSLQGIFIVDQGGIEYINSAAEKITGYSFDELRGLSFEQLKELIHPEDQETVLKRLQDRLSGKATVARYEYRILDKDGQYRWLEQFAGPSTFGGLKAVQASFIDITDRKQYEQQLKDSHDALRRMAERMEDIRERERHRMARDIHDQLGQELTVLKMDTFALREEIAEGQHKGVSDLLNSIINRLDRLIEAVREISIEFRPPVLDDLSLAEAIKWKICDFRQHTGINCEMELNPEGPELNTALATVVYRILQESLTNIARHASASEVKVKLDINDSEIILSVTDNGTGFQPDNIDRQKSLGITGMKERASLWDGELQVVSVPGQGTRITLNIPYSNRWIDG